MKKIIFTIFLLLIVVISCKKRGVSDLEKDYYAVETEAVASLASGSDTIAIDYKGIYFKVPESWTIDTTKVDEGVYKILIKPSYVYDEQDKIVINIHDAVLDPSTYLLMLKTQITNSSRTENVSFTKAVSSKFKNGDITECTFSGGYKNEYGEYSGLIKIYQNKAAKKTYSLLYLLDNRNNDDFGDDLNLLVNSITVGSK
ncbi:hypothetical protein [Dysgonomonas sp. ZJ709]|uniref:hypothetical protein n=1 Tax=Dysgonomonas sp. ZJ709 TaxID=2709797 RepID=UPI0013E9D24C|nr:hypothetical protein [Dysgonomonas sp. ZJ709]